MLCARWIESSTCRSKKQAAHTQVCVCVCECFRLVFYHIALYCISNTDQPVPIGYSATLSAPHMHAMCLEHALEHVQVDVCIYMCVGECISIISLLTFNHTNESTGSKEREERPRRGLWQRIPRLSLRPSLPTSTRRGCRAHPGVYDVHVYVCIFVYVNIPPHICKCIHTHIHMHVYSTIRLCVISAWPISDATIASITSRTVHDPHARESRCCARTGDSDMRTTHPTKCVCVSVCVCVMCEYIYVYMYAIGHPCRRSSEGNPTQAPRAAGCRRHHAHPCRRRERGPRVAAGMHMHTYTYACHGM
jgi:hypothetical protein